MEDKIEVGEYVRTISGKIGIFDRYSKRNENSFYKSPFNCFIKLQYRKTSLQCCREYIKNHSKNIIDLIENKDIIEVIISEEWIADEDKKRIIVVGQTANIEEIKENIENGIFKIESIATKEQFESVKYKVN